MTPINLWAVCCRDGRLHQVNAHKHYRLVVSTLEMAQIVAKAFDVNSCGPHTVVWYIKCGQ